MLHDGRSPEAPTSAAGDSIILHVPSCVQRFSSRRRILSRLRAMARRRSRAAPEPPAEPVKLLVEENPHWPASGDELLAAAAAEARRWAESEVLVSDGQEDDEAPMSTPAPEATEPRSSERPAQQAVVDPNAAVIQQLMEDNRDLKAALCRLIRISEQNEAALRLLEEENEELSTLVHRLTIGQASVVNRQPPVASGRWWQRAWGGEWLKRQAQRCI